MKIALCSIGSRGDIQPFLVLGEYLSQQGHDVKVASAKMYQSLAANYAVSYEYFEGNYAAIMDDEAMKKEIGSNPFTLGKALKEKVYPILENSLDKYYELLQWADVVLYHPKTMIDGIGSEMQHKLIKAYVVPAFTPTREFANPILKFLPLPKFLNTLSYQLANALMGAFDTPMKNFRKKHQLPKSKALLNTPMIYGISPSFIALPSDYPSDHHFTGFWMKANIQQGLSDELTQFMTDEISVLIITFGSMPYQSAIDINDFVNAIIQQYAIKVLVVRGWGLKETNIATNERIMAIDAAPFDVLFPLADFVVHHGGAGTTAIALKSGIPQMICPVLHPFGDQYFWGKQLEQKGAGATPIPLKKLTVRQLLKGVQQLQQKELKAAAKQLQQAIATENGLAQTLTIIEKHYSQYAGNQ